jgi:CRP-like cAMP-binding protein
MAIPRGEPWINMAKKDEKDYRVGMKIETFDGSALELAGTLLATIVPFRYLSAPTRQHLLVVGCRVDLVDSEMIFTQGDAGDDSVYLLLSGSAESLDMERSPWFRKNVLEPGTIFGEQSGVFGTPRSYGVRTLEASSCFRIPGEHFRILLSESRAFAQAFGAKLRDSLGIFDAFDLFLAEIVRGVALGHLEIRRFVDLYRNLAPALHRRANDQSVIDFDALAYAARRLPDNTLETFVFLLTDNLPSVYASPDLLFPPVATDARRRFVYRMMPGKDMVLVRSGLSDLLDFVTCLCLFSVETRKIRYRLNHPEQILALSSHCAQPSGTRQDDDGFMVRLPFSPDELASIKRIWPERTVERIRDIVFHRQAYSVDVRKQVNNYNASLSERWTAQIGEAARQAIGSGPADFPDELAVHIVSSNTHSVSNCLNPFFVEHAEEILSWADSTGRRSGGWAQNQDEVYYLARDWFRDNPGRVDRVIESEAACGIIRVPETMTTGIQVQLIDPSRVCRSPIDPGVRVGSCGGSSLIVNIDYAFGEQAEEIMRNLLMLFGRNVRSISVLGKAGALEGQRGDVLAPNAFIEQAGDAFQPLPAADAEAMERLRAALPGRRVIEGPLLTVRGTLLQNQRMLNFYRRVWACVGLEMEGAYYWRAILESEQLGVLRAGAAKRFYYYVSDAPLAAGESLSARLTPQEGVPPLYAITREILTGIIS